MKTVADTQQSSWEVNVISQQGQAVVTLRNEGLSYREKLSKSLWCLDGKHSPSSQEKLMSLEASYYDP